MLILSLIGQIYLHLLPYEAVFSNSGVARLLKSSKSGHTSAYLFFQDCQ